MCNPVALAWAAFAVTAGSTVLQAQDARSTAEYNENVSKIQAQDARNRGYATEQAVRERAKAAMGAQRAAMGASGSAIGMGTNANLELETAGAVERDVMASRNNAIKEAWSYDAQAGLDRLSGQQGVRSAMMSGAGSMISSASNVYKAGKVK